MHLISLAKYVRYNASRRYALDFPQSKVTIAIRGDSRGFLYAQYSPTTDAFSPEIENIFKKT